ncbi:hypothetical protein NE865_03000 [Phthorimaea operculella]|nr:hypothetical protein NE865_03000 [Phthorimaea operculella]
MAVEKLEDVTEVLENDDMDDEDLYDDDEESEKKIGAKSPLKDEMTVEKLEDVTEVLENDDMDDEDLYDDDEESGDYYMDYDKRARHDEMTVEKLEDVTEVLENDDMDDEDLYDDDEESGDYYMDYDKRARHSPLTKDKMTVEKLEDVTEVLENDDMDDEDLYDDDEESGDYYMDYDKRARHDGTPSYVRFNADDMTDAIINLEKTNQAELKQLIDHLNENPEATDIDLPSSLKGSVESQEDTAQSREKRSVFPEASPDSSDTFHSPKSLSKDEERRKTKKFNPESDDPLSKVALHSITRTVRSEDGSTSRGRPFIAAHFHGNTSHLNTETHEHYKGNGLLRVAHDKPHDVWYPSPWTIASPHPRPTLTRNGHIKVHHTGIYYLDSHDIISWVLHRTNSEIEGRETLLQCAQSTHSSEVMDKPNSCFSASALFLKAGDRLAVRNTGGDRHSLMQPEKSFIGLIKLADAEDPNDDY